MPYYKLRPSSRADLKVDEIILSRHEDSGDVEYSLSTHIAREIPEEFYDEAVKIVERVGLSIEEADEPTSEELYQQEVGVDVAGAAPLISASAANPQQQVAPSASQTAATSVDQADSSTVDSGSAATSDTPSTRTPTQSTT